jgi:hypothetical protein
LRDRRIARRPSSPRRCGCVARRHALLSPDDRSALTVFDNVDDNRLSRALIEAADRRRFAQSDAVTDDPLSDNCRSRRAASGAVIRYPASPFSPSRLWASYVMRHRMVN